MKLIFNNQSIKKFFYVLLVTSLVMSYVIPVIESEAATPKTTKVTLSKSNVSLYKGQLYKLSAKKANIKVKHKAVKWYSSNNKIVIVN